MGTSAAYRLRRRRLPDLILSCVLLSLAACAGPQCGNLEVRPAPPPSELDFVIDYPAGVSGIRVEVVTVPQNPGRTAWILEEKSPGRLANPLSIKYGVVPQGMTEGDRAVPIPEGALVRVEALYPSGSFWHPVCTASRLFRRVGGRFVEAPEGR